jgi:hypothetical protein
MDKGLPGLPAEGDQRLLAALAPDKEGTGLQVQVLEFKETDFRVPKPGGVEQLEEGPVADSQGRGEVGAAKEGQSLRFAQDAAGQLAGPLGEGQRGGHVLGDAARFV